MIPDSVIQDDNAHTMHYSQSLPYAHLLDNEASNWLAEICTNLVISVQAKDYTGGTLAWVKRLSSYLDMKHAIDKQMRINLAKLLYELTVLPGMEPVLVQLWASTCVRLIKHNKKLEPTDLELPWRPLYELIDKALFPKTRQRALISESKLLSDVTRLVSYATRFFPSTAAEEILQEFLPTYNPHHVSEAQRVLGYIVLFLPTENQPHYKMKVQESLSTLFSLWSTLTMSNSIDMQFTFILSHIAERNIAEGGSEVSLFTKDQVKTLYTVLLRMLSLPVGTRGDGSMGNGAAATTGYGQHSYRFDMRAGNAAVLRRGPERFRSIARFIVYTMMPDLEEGGKSYSLNLLADLIQATELYFHPSNTGSWSFYLPDFVKNLANQFLKRWREEMEDDCKTPQHKRLTPQLRQQFVLILRPVTYLSMFGKDPVMVRICQTSLKYLSWLEPSLIFPGLLERIYPSLETLTETHRTSSVLSILTDIALPLFSRDHYPAGGKHLLPLLQLAIPGIDMNDPIKTISCLMFISSALMSIPIFDLTHVPTDYYPVEDDIGVEGAELSRETEDYLTKATTGEFEEWLAKFMRRVFVIFENLPQENRKKQNNNMEGGLTQMLLHTCDIIFNQLSDRLYDLALKLVVEFIGDRVLPNAVRAVGQLCDALTSVNPKKASKVFVPLCITHIQMELEHGAASTVSHSDASNLIPSDATFHWYQNILFSVVSSMGPEILVYRTDLVAITHTMINQCRSRRGMMWTGKLVRGILGTMLNIYPTDYKSLNPSQWQDKEFMEKNAHLVWGQPGDPANLEIQWHTPSEPEKDFALAFLAEILTPSMNRLQQMMKENSNTDSHQMSNEFCRHLAIVRNCVMGSSVMVADDGVAAEDQHHKMDIDGEEEEEGDAVKVPQLEVGYTFTDESDPRMAKAREFRRSIGDLIHQLAEYFKTQREDDVESIKVLIKIARSYLSERGIEKSQFDQSKNGYHYAKNVSFTPLCKKRYPRNLLIRRAFNHHLLRLRQNVQGRVRTPLHDTILKDLLEMSLGPYAAIRKVSQKAVTATARCFRDSKSLIIPVLLDALQPNTPADRMKGALYLFTHKSILMACLRNWRFIPDFVMALCGAHHQDKLTIQELTRKVFVSYLEHFHSFSFRVLPTAHIEEAIKTLSPETVNHPDFIPRTKAKEAQVAHRVKERVKAYEGLMVKLLAFLKDARVHWRYAAMASNFIEMFFRSGTKPTKDLAAFVNNAMLSELPTLRRIGVSATTQMLLVIKQRSFAKGDEELLITKNVRNPLKIQVDVQEGEGKRLLDASYQPLTESGVLVDNLDVGWYVWPQHYTAYKVNTERDFLFDDAMIDPACLESYEEFKKTFNSSDYWVKLCGYVSQEINNKEEDRFRHSHARLFLSIFQTFGSAPLEIAKPEIEKLCLASDQKNAQRAASEILAGLIRGTKHWSIGQLDHLWTSWLTPLLSKVFNAITPDSLTYWESFVRFAAQRRDPRRIQPLMTLILEAEMDPTSDAAFNESRKLVLARTLMVCLQWRFHPLIERMLSMYLNNIQHPYKQVREILGFNINELLQLEWVPSYPSVPQLLAENAKIDGVGNVPTALTPHQAERTQVILNKLDRWLEEMNQSNAVTSNSGSSDYAHASKTLLCWLYEATKDWVVAGTLPYVLPFLPKLFAMQEINDDQDLHIMATNVLGFIARLNYPPSMIPLMIDEFLNILTTSSSWHIRVRALPVLQIFFFKHLFLMNSEELIRIMEVVGQMLKDTQIEVRQLASVTLGGLVRCSQRDAIQSLLTQFSSKMQVRVPKRKRDIITGKNVEPAGFAEAVLEKHAGVLGISCLINAFPYEVPEWMPVILCQLADCMSDPAAEIQATIRKTFSDFRRTHSDTWHEDMHKFTEDQLSILSDMLISPSYYA